MQEKEEKDGAQVVKAFNSWECYFILFRWIHMSIHLAYAAS